MGLGWASPPTASFALGNFMTRAAAVSKHASSLLIATDREALLAYDLRDGTSKETLGWIDAAPDWTTALALTADARTVARGGHYNQVEIFDLDAKRRKTLVRLGEQAHTVALAFSEDGQRLAIDYVAFEGRVAKHRIRVIESATGKPIVEVDVPPDQLRWTSFLPSKRNSYWLASTAGGRVHLCDTGETCRMTGASP